MSASIHPTGGRFRFLQRSGVRDWPQHFGAMGKSYEDRAFTHPVLAEQGTEELEIVLRSLGEGRGRMLLDIGAGTGRFTIPLLQAGWNVTSFDGSREMLDCIGSRAPKASLVQGRLGEPLAFESNTFDAVVAMRVTKYVPNVHEALREMSRVATPGAPVLFDVANRNSLARFGYGDSTMGFLTPSTLRPLAMQNGLQVTRTHDGFRLPHAVVGRDLSPRAAQAVIVTERCLARVFGIGTGRGARSIIVEATSR